MTTTSYQWRATPRAALLFLTAYFLLPLCGWSQAQYPSAVLRFADLVLYNGKILTADRDTPDFTITEAVAIRDGKILATGDNQTMRALAGPQTQQIDLHGRSVIPGSVASD